MKVNLGYCCVSVLNKSLWCNLVSTKTYLEQHRKRIKRQLYEAGKIANQLNMQISTHPSQYYVLNSLKSEVVKKRFYR